MEKIGKMAVSMVSSKGEEVGGGGFLMFLICSGTTTLWTCKRMTDNSITLPLLCACVVLHGEITVQLLGMCSVCS